MVLGEMTCGLQGQHVSSTPVWHDGSAALLLLAQHIRDLISISKEATHSHTPTCSFIATLASKDSLPKTQHFCCYFLAEFTQKVLDWSQYAYISVCLCLCVACSMWYELLNVLFEGQLAFKHMNSHSQPIRGLQWQQPVTKQERNGKSESVAAKKLWLLNLGCFTQILNLQQRRSIQAAQFQGGQQRAISPVSDRLGSFLSLGYVLKNGQWSVYAEHYNFTMKLTFGLIIAQFCPVRHLYAVWS